jgi:formamidopyrimidine-DNA glycosylase
MPELPEVQTIVTALQPKLTGQIIRRVQIRRPDVISPTNTKFHVFITGQKITTISRRGKRIIFQLGTGDQFYIHLGMTGRLTLTTAAPALHTHIIFEIAEYQLHFSDPRRFGGIFCLGKTESPDKGLGPEPLEIRAGELAAALSRTTRAIKNALLDQTVLAGVGNIYADEALFESHIHPLTRSDQLSPVQTSSLTKAIKKVLRRALLHRGSTLRDYRDASGNPGDFQKLHRVYGREGQPCHICKTKIIRITLTGRSAHFCPVCQV